MAKDRKKYFEGVTPTGFRFHVDKGVLDDMEVIDLLSQLEDGEIGALPKLLLKILGKKQKEALYQHCRDKNGRVPSTKVTAELKAIMTNENLKKS